MNQLKRKAEFHQALRDYKPSEAALETVKDLKLVLLNAPSASGRNTIINELLETGEYHFIVSDTTRAQRVNNGILEQNGREYWFKTEDEVMDGIKSGEYLEAEVIHNQQVSGINIQELTRAKSTNKIAIDEVENKGIANVVRVKPDTVAIAILPPSFDEWLKRFTGRGEMSKAEQRNRFETAIEIYKLAMAGTYTIVVNDKLADAVDHVNRLAHGVPRNEIAQQKNQKLAEDLYWHTMHYLKSVLALD